MRDRFNRQLLPQEKTLTQKIAASAAARGMTNPDDSPITVDQIENAMRSANNSKYGENITTGMVVSLNSSTKASDIYDNTEMQHSSDGAGNNYFVQNQAMLATLSQALQTLIQQSTGEANSPYSWSGSTLGVATSTTMSTQVFFVDK